MQRLSFPLSHKSSLKGDAAQHNSSLGLAGIGAFYEHYYLTDLPTLDVSGLRFVVFLNAFAPSEGLRTTIAKKFAGSNATLLFLGPAGIVEVNDTACTADAGRVAAFTGIGGLRALDAPVWDIASQVALDEVLKV